jgi:hypothetical protein
LGRKNASIFLFYFVHVIWPLDDVCTFVQRPSGNKMPAAQGYLLKDAGLTDAIEAIQKDYDGKLTLQRQSFVAYGNRSNRRCGAVV